MIKVCVISDGHGYLPKLESCELVLICGDMIPLNRQLYTDSTYKWYRNTFKEWANSLDCKKVIFIAGNHELSLPNYYNTYKELFPDMEKITYLCNEEYVYTGSDGNVYKIFGTPYCKIFGNWAFMLPDSELEEKYSKIPENLDILITHDAPYGVSDILLQKECKWANGEHIGNKPLAKAILEKVPKIVCHGHLHSTSREFEILGGSKVINCSLKDEFYKPIYPPIYFEIQK